MSKKKLTALILMITGIFIIAGFGIVTYLNSQKTTAGLKVETNIDSLVFVDNQQIGSSPVDKMFKPQEVSVKIIPSTTGDNLTSFQTKVKLEANVYTVIKQEFGSTDAQSAGETISLVKQSGKTASLSIVTTAPDTTASVTVDGQPQGFTPLIVPSLPAGSHQVVVSAPGYVTRTVPVQTVSGYKLVLSVKLAAVVEQTPTPTPTPEISATPSATPKVTGKPSGSPAPTPKVSPTATPKTSPTPTPKSTTQASPTPAVAKPYVTILDTPTGFLRVRQKPSTGSTEVGQVKPGESFSLLDSQSGWYLIKVDLDATSSGWISAQYAKKTE